ncbi:MAG: DNA topoisomerase IV subunit A [Proteobacteria bacterium]|nr:DNA topoisomerase IV subunit A [Desulfobulbaceae bacterium]MBU4152185.1 DNA topoisomerase IV subunit A [Pseudomonadota bacterium]
MIDSDYGTLHQLFDTNFLEYTSYVVKERAIPHVADGLKPVQRRIMQTLKNMDDGRFNKVANVVGEAMKLHPHGDASIFAALVNLSNKGFLIDQQGNFGNTLTGDSASAARYIECRLSPLALEVMFNKDLTEFADSYDGRMQEPVVLPAKIPLLLMQGADGIAVGMATKIMPHNFVELLTAQKQILRDEPFEIFPDFPQGGLVDVTHYDRGNGRLKCRARIEEINDKTIVIREVPYTTTTTSLVESIEKAVRAGKLKIVSINDYTAETVEVEIKLARGMYASDTISALYAFTDCEVPISPNFTVIKDNQPMVMNVDDVLRYNTQKLVVDLEKELTIELDRLREKIHAALLEQIFIEERLYKEIEECSSYELVVSTVDSSLKPFADRLLRAVTREDIERLLEIRIKRISRYDISKKQQEINGLRKEATLIERHLKDMVKYTIGYLDGLLKKYGDNYPRRTEITTFSEVAARAVALSNLTCGYDPKTGFLGYQVKAEPEHSFACSEYDKFILIFRDGMYKVINGVDKLFVGSDLVYVGKDDEKLIFNVIYRDGTENFSYIKRFPMPKFILDKEYRLFPDDPKSRIQYFATGEGSRVRVYFVPTARAKVNSFEVVFNDYLVKGVSAKGKRAGSRVLRRIVPLVDKEVEKESVPLSLPGMGEGANQDSSAAVAEKVTPTDDKPEADE